MSHHETAGRFACRHFDMFHFQMEPPKLLYIFYKVWLRFVGCTSVLTFNLSLETFCWHWFIPGGIWDVVARATRTNPKPPFVLHRARIPPVGSNGKWAEQAASSRAPSILLVESRAHKEQSSVENREWPSRNVFESLKSASRHFSRHFILTDVCFFFVYLKAKQRHVAMWLRTATLPFLTGAFVSLYPHLKVCAFFFLGGGIFDHACLLLN